MKLSFNKIHEYYLFPFETRASLFHYVERVLPEWNLLLIKGKGGGTTHCQETRGVTEEGNTYCIKGRRGGGLRYENKSPS